MSGFERATIAFELRVEELPTAEKGVLSSYRRAFASRGVLIRTQADPVGPHLFASERAPIDAVATCYWNRGDNAGVDPHARECPWVWHHGPTTELVAGTDPRVIHLPRNDLFEIRGVDNTPDGWAQYRARIASPWSEKRDELYFRGHFTGTPTVENPRLVACRQVEAAGIPADVGLLAESTPLDLRRHVATKEWEPLAAMADYKFVLSLWGNHPFNPRLYRGLEAGSLVFHQATPTIRLLDDGLLVPGEHYVELAPDLCDLVDKVDHFMSHTSEARDIAAAGHRAWMETLFVDTPYDMPDVIWDRFTSQPNWPDFCTTFQVTR